jgi:hypothetical protein
MNSKQKIVETMADANAIWRRGFDLLSRSKEDDVSGVLRIQPLRAIDIDPSARLIATDPLWQRFALPWRGRPVRSGGTRNHPPRRRPDRRAWRVRCRVQRGARRWIHLVPAERHFHHSGYIRSHAAMLVTSSGPDDPEAIELALEHLRTRGVHALRAPQAAGWVTRRQRANKYSSFS